tara:strand:+ start:6852 stop:7868 length:1017 start_codon:yes stop_codon:yes gene_type:complete
MILSKFQVNNIFYESFKKTLIIAEIGSNHDNQLNKCKKMILEAKKAGCDAVKFQLFKADLLVSKKYNYKGYKILKKLEMDESWIPILSKFCKKNKILFACSPFYPKAIDLLKKNKCDILKIASPEIKNINLIKKAVKSGLPLIISTGDTGKEEIERAFKNLKKKNFYKTAFLHCTSKYPCDDLSANLLGLNYIKKLVDNKISVGYSDHTIDNLASSSAVCMGANIIEKHITLNKKSKGPDHFFAIEVNELSKMVKTIRRIEKLAGSSYKSRLNSENTVYINCFSKSNLKKGHVIKLERILFKRDFVKGVQAHETKKIINKKLKRNLIANERIEAKHFY